MGSSGHLLSFLPLDPVLLVEILRAIPTSMSPGTGPMLDQGKFSVPT